MWDQPFISESNVELSRLLEAEFTTHCTTFEASKESGVVGGGGSPGVKGREWEESHSGYRCAWQRERCAGS